jgi:hypothetical protein
MKTPLPSSSSRLLARRTLAMKKFSRLGPVLRGSLVTARRGGHLAHQLTLSVQGKTHTVYVPPGMVKEVKTWIRNYRQMTAIAKEVSKLNMALIHRHVPESRAASKS